MLKRIKNIGNFFYYLLILVLVVISFSTTFSVMQIPGGSRVFVVQSGSMEPAIKTGSVVFVVPAKEYKEKDVITYLSNPQANIKDVKATVTHRVVSISNAEGRKTFKTKGDANQTPDSENVTESQVLGKVFFSVPFLGYPVAFAKTQMGFVFLIVIPATVIVYSELVSIKNEAKKLIEERKTRKLNLVEKVEEKIGEEILEIEKEVKKKIKKKGVKKKNG